jgi:hypothetical protein
VTLLGTAPRTPQIHEARSRLINGTLRQELPELCTEIMGVMNDETRAEAACGRRDMRRISGQKDAPFAEAFRNPGTNYPWVGAKHSERSLANAKGAGDDRPAIALLKEDTTAGR